MQNEILGDLDQEFSSAPEKGKVLPHEEPGVALGDGFPSRRQDSYPASLVQVVSALVPLNNTSWGLGPQRADGVLLLKLLRSLQNAWVLRPRRKRGWTELLLSMPNVRVSHCRSPHPVFPMAGEMEGDYESLEFQAEQYQFAGQQIELYSRHFEKDPRAGDLKYEAEKANSVALEARLDAISRERGDFYVDDILLA